MNRIRMMLATLLVGIMAAAGITLGASPALAEAGGTCDANSFCLYQWTNYGAQVYHDRYERGFDEFGQFANNCINIRPSVWANFTNVVDNSLSMGWNGSSAYVHYVVTYYNGSNCNASTGWGQTPLLTSLGGLANLNSYVYPEPAGSNISLAHSIASLSLNYKN
jgi:hypothetical protein